MHAYNNSHPLSPAPDQGAPDIGESGTSHGCPFQSYQDNP